MDGGPLDTVPCAVKGAPPIPPRTGNMGSGCSGHAARAV